MLNTLRRCSWVAILFLALLPGQVVAGSTYPGETRDRSGIALVGPTPYQVVAKNPAQATAFDQALTLAEKNPDDMGYPWLDPISGTLALSATDDSGKAAGLSAKTGAQISAVPIVITTAPASITTLNRISDAVTRLHAQGLSHSDLIYETEPDQEHNRIIITVVSLNESLMTALASRFGTDLIAVRVQGPQPNAGSDSRKSDSPPFYGGAYWQDSVSACTTGFAWNADGQSALLSAGHCAPGGTAKVDEPGYSNIGYVNSREDNWSRSTGTTYYEGQTTYRGDVALIRLRTYASAADIYVGGPTSNASAWVAQMNPRRAGLGDTACVGGQVTGEWCGMVTVTGVNMKYLADGPNVWARNISVAFAAGNTCPTHGDSGAPVYYHGSNGVIAEGTYSGGAPAVAACTAYFTDIRDSYSALVGYLKV